MSLIPRVIVRRWLETVLALFSLAMPVLLLASGRDAARASSLKEDANAHALGTGWCGGVVFGLLGDLGILLAGRALLPRVFADLCHQPRRPHLVGKGGWLDKREVRFYLACFALVCPPGRPC